MTEKKIRIWLSASVAIVTVILFAFIWLVNLNQTAEMMGLPLSTVKTKYYRALDKFKKLPGIV